MTVLRESIDRTGKSLTEKKLNMKITSSSTMHPYHPRHAAALAGLALVASMLLSGCSAGISGTQTGSKPVAGGLTIAQGRVFGGQQPVAGASIQLYTVNTSATGGASTALISSTVTTSDGTGTSDANANAGNANNTLSLGNFTITGDYACTSATQVYITATGGNAGGGTNAALGLMAALGPCTTVQTTAFININELTTVAAVYSLAPFMTDFKHVGSNTAANPNGLVNAFNMANTLVNFTTGQVATPSAGLTLPASRINTLGDILASCINGVSGASTPACTTLLTTTGAAETIGAGLAIAKNPGSSAMTGLFSLVTGTPPFTALGSAPADLTLAVNYTGSELLGPAGIAIDTSGNAWVTNGSGFSVVKLPSLSSSFATTTYSGGYLLSPRGISIDRSGNVWIANTGGNTVVELSSAGTVLSGSGFNGGSISTPVAIATDSAGNAWVANFSGNSITELNATGTPSGSSPITGSSALSEPSSIALDSSGNVAVANSGTGQLCLFSNAAVFQSCVSDGYLFGSTGIAISSTGSIAMAGSTTGTAVTGAFTLATNTGTVNAASPVFGGGLTIPAAVAFDGNGNAWFANTGSLSEFAGTTAVSPSAGLGSLNAPAAIAVDDSGNIWTANSGDNSVSVFVGLGTPIRTPIAANVGP